MLTYKGTVIMDLKIAPGMDRPMFKGNCLPVSRQSIYAVETCDNHRFCKRLLSDLLFGEKHTITWRKYTFCALCHYVFHIHHTEIMAVTPSRPRSHTFRTAAWLKTGGGLEVAVRAGQWPVMGSGAQQQSTGIWWEQASKKWDTVYYHPRVSTSQLHLLL